MAQNCGKTGLIGRQGCSKPTSGLAEESSNTMTRLLFPLSEIRTLIHRSKAQTGLHVPDGEGEVRVGLVAARIVLDVADRRVARQDPLVTDHVVRHVHLLKNSVDVTCVCAWVCVYVYVPVCVGIDVCGL